MTTTGDRAATARPVGVLLGGTVVLGISGFLVLALVAVATEPHDYAEFGVFWSALYFVAAVLFGVQQEVTRAVVASPGPQARDTSIARFGTLVAVVSFVVVGGSGLFWVPPAIDGAPPWFAVVVATGAVGYVLSAALTGVLSGAGEWRAYAAILAAEGVIRIILVSVVVSLEGGIWPLGWAVVLAFPFSALAVLIPLRRRIGRFLVVSSSLPDLLRNVTRTIAASAAIAALINGFPLLMALFSRGASTKTIGALTLAVMLTRAPVLLPLLAMQSYMITSFSTGPSVWPLLSRLLALTAACGAALSLLAAAVGPSLIEWVFGEGFGVGRWVLASLVFSSAELGAMLLTSSAMIPRRQHTANAVSWLVAFVASTSALATLPGGLEVRTPIALVVGPAIGWALQVAALRRKAVTRIVQ